MLCGLLFKLARQIELMAHSLFENHALMPVLFGQCNAKSLDLFNVCRFHNSATSAFKGQLLLQKLARRSSVHGHAPVTAKVRA